MSVTLFDSTPTCPEKDFFEHSMLTELPADAYQSIFEPTDDWWHEPETLTFSVESLNLAATCLRKFLATRYTFDWFHLQVHAVAFSSFYRAMEEEKGTTVLLPFWCWCDGGSLPKARHRQHRHMIAVSPKGHFLDHVFKKVTIASHDQPFTRYKSIHCLYIKSPQHLINTIGYVSQRNSKCQTSAHVQTNLNHFYINKSLPKMSKWVLACLWKKGLEKLLYEKYRLVHPFKLAAYAQRIDNTWKISLKYLPFLPRNLVFPVSPEFFPTNQVTPYYLHLGANQKLYFEKRELQLKGLEWGREQARLGNCFCRAIENEWWTLSEDQARFLDIQPFQRRIEQLEQENAYLKTKLFMTLDSMNRRVVPKEEYPRLNNVGCMDLLLCCV